MKSMLIAAAAIAIASPALAGDKAAVAAHGNELALAFDAKQAQKLLVSQGYTGVSQMERVADGRWVGTAVKDGKTIIVGVNLPKPAAPTTN